MTRTTRTKPGLRAALGIDSLSGMALAASVGVHVGVVCLGVAVGAFSRAERFTPGPAQAPAGLATQVATSGAPLDDAPLRDDAPRPAPTRPAEHARHADALLAPATLVDRAVAAAAPLDAPPVADLRAAMLQSDPGALAAPSSVRAAPTVFGVRGQREAERVVYLVDASGSMVAALPIVMREVARSIDALAPTQRFSVGVYGGWGVASPSNLEDRQGFTLATESNKAAARRWLERQNASGNGEALGAIRWALTKRPDVVFLLSKGITDRGMTRDERARAAAGFLAEVERLNPLDESTGWRPVRIRAVEFFDADAEGLLEELGARHGAFGSTSPADRGHRFISRRELGIE